MGWKNVKEHYRIGHFVHVKSDGICIGSPYINDIIVINNEGKVIKRYDRNGNDDLERYQKEFDSDPEKLKHLIQTPDTFSASIAVYTYDGGQILEKACEEPGWPNVTHDGQIMYDNHFSTDKDKVVSWAKCDANCGILAHKRNIAKIEADLDDYRNRLAVDVANRQRLEGEYPGIIARFV